jgi:Ca2+/H+ antiporter
MNKILLTLLVLQGSVADKFKNRREAGQGSLEYVAMIGVAVMIVVAIAALATPAGTAMGGLINSAITKVKTALALP